MKKHKLFERTLSTKRIYRGRVVSLREDVVKLPNNGTSKREVVEHPGAVAVIALTADNKIILVRQFRKPTGQVLLEIPAGLVHKGEKHKDAAVRELEEETGFKARSVKSVLCAFSSPGYSSEIIRYFIARGLKRTKPGPDHDEFIEVEALPLKKAMRMVVRGSIKDNKTIVGILMAQKWKNT